MGKLRWINKGSQQLRLNIPKCEEHYGGVYIADLCLKTKSGWSENPVSVFYQPKPDFEKGHTHYFGLIVDDDRLLITNGISASEGLWNAAVADNGEVIFSRWRHDYRESKDGSVMVDGGRDYFKTSAMRPEQHVKLKLDGPDFVICDEA